MDVIVWLFVGGFVGFFLIQGAILLITWKISDRSLSLIENFVKINQITSTKLNPHVVDPKTFGPTGMAREDEAKRLERSLDEDPDEEELRRAEEAYFAKVKAMQSAGIVDGVR